MLNVADFQAPLEAKFAKLIASWVYCSFLMLVSCRHILLFKPLLVGGWPTSLKNDGVRQLGWWHSQYMEKKMFPTTYQFCWTFCWLNMVKSHCQTLNLDQVFGFRPHDWCLNHAFSKKSKKSLVDGLHISHYTTSISQYILPNTSLFRCFNHHKLGSIMLNHILQRLSPVSTIWV